MGGGGKSGAFPIHSVWIGTCHEIVWKQQPVPEETLLEHFSYKAVVLPFPPLSLVSLLPLKTQRNQAPQAKPIAIFHPGERITSITKSL